MTLAKGHFTAIIALEAFIERERRLANLDIADLQDRCGARTARELANRIEIKAIYSHPAWEEMIEGESLEVSNVAHLAQPSLRQHSQLNWHPPQEPISVDYQRWLVRRHMVADVIDHIACVTFCLATTAGTFRLAWMRMSTRT